jgi:TusA-related sulfurtransferase
MDATRTTPVTPAARDAITTGEAFVARLVDRDFEKLETCFHPQVRFRALVPSGLRERTGSADTVALLKSWFSEPNRMQLLQREVYLVSQRVRISYRFRELYSDGETEVIEQNAFCDVREGLIESMDILCSGFLPEPKGDAVADLPLHRFDSGDLGCGSGLPQEFRRQVSAIPVGHVLEVVTRDPSAKEDLPSLARLLGHQVLSVGTAANGSVVVAVKRGR